MKPWHPTSWQQHTYFQRAPYPCAEHLQKSIAELKRLPPLVTPLEVDRLRQRLADAAEGRAFVLQGGDCAELFSDCNEQTIANKIKILLQMSVLLAHGLKKPVVYIGRIAGQYAKPRSMDYETHEGVTLPSYRGDLINRAEFDVAARTPDPERMVQGYGFASLTLNYIRGLVESGFASLHHPEYWDLDFAANSQSAQEYQRHVARLRQTAPEEVKQWLQSEHFFTSHEALHLDYEQALTRQAPMQRWYNLSTHLPWVGMRTAFKDSAHIEYLRGIENPIAIKVGASLAPETLLALCQQLNPDNKPGRLMLIHRFGQEHIARCLPAFIAVIQKAKQKVLWSCDPMHGNTVHTEKGIKTRYFDAILTELEHAFVIHKQHGSELGGVHFELTGENVTECMGGARGLTEADLERAYKSLVDPRLNYEQSLEMALHIVRYQAQAAKQYAAYPLGDAA